MKLFVVGQYSSGVYPDVIWGLGGVFDNEAAAVAACTTPNHFYGPVILNEVAPIDDVEWLEQTFPHALKALT